MSIQNISNQKSVLAKLLAQENITVEHRKIPTAYFDPKNRVLGLPVWKNMSSDLYDLLVGHEVGHAWETPPDGWHDAIEEKGKGFKSFLNVVEDARIEKLIKSRYPGLRSPMYRGYQELFDQDFFGVKNKNLSSLSLIDRLNLHFKLGSFTNVPFKNEEEDFVERMNNLKSWEDVYTLASELYQYQKDNPTTSLDELEYGEEEGWQDAGDDDYETLEENEESTNSKEIRGGSFVKEPQSDTDVSFREKEKTLLDNSFHPYVYVNLPEANYKNHIIHYSKIYNLDFSKYDNYSSTLKEYGIEDDEEASIFLAGKLLSDYRNKNLKFIGYLVKEFELRRNASQYARASISKTGEINLEKIWAYKLKDDLFKRVTKIPNGKNHAMIMFLDWSGSMSENITNTIEQIIILADFCRKVNIPFEVYAFSDVCASGDNEQRIKSSFIRPINVGDLVLRTNINLMNLLSSTMSNAQYRNAQIRLLQIGKSFERDLEKRSWWSLRHQCLPRNLSLGGTPLNEAIVLANYLVSDYKKERKIDVISTIFLTDGDGNDCPEFLNSEGKAQSFKSYCASNYFNLILKDKRSTVSVVAKPTEMVTNALLRLLKVNSNGNLIGYFICSRSPKNTAINVANQYGNPVTAEQVSEYLKKNKFYSVKNTGFDEYFVVQEKDLEIGDETLVVGSNQKKEVMKAFIKNQKNKILNRVFLNKFIQLIA